MSRYRQVLGAFGPEYLLTLPVVLGSLLWFVVMNLTDTGSNGTTSFPARIVAIVLAQVVLFAVPGAVWVLWRKSTDRERLTAFLMLAVVVSCVIRGVAFAWLLYALGAMPTVDVAFRIATSVTQMTLSVGLLWFGTTAVRRHALRRDALVAEQTRLLELQSQAEVQLRQLDEAAVEQVRTSILEGLGRGAPADGAEVLSRLRLTIEDVVRPLSRQLETQGEVWTVPALSAREHRIRWWQALRDAADPPRIHPFLIVAMVVWVAVAPVTARYGFEAAAATVASILIVLTPALWLTRLIGVHVTRGRPSWLRALFFTGALLASGFAFAQSEVLYARLTSVNWSFAAIGFSITLLIGVVLAVGDAAMMQGRAVEEELVRTSRDLQWAVARSREEHRQHRLALAHAVHGRIQASLAAAIIRLERAIADGTMTEKMGSEVQRQVIDSVVGLELRTSDPDPLDALLRKVRSTWQGATHITLTCTSEAERALAGDVQCLATLNDVVPELVFNSVRHGRASNIELSLSSLDERTIDLRVTDDGLTSGPASDPGLGTRLLDDCAIVWSRDRIVGSTVTTLVLPVLPAWLGYRRR